MKIRKGDMDQVSLVLNDFGEKIIKKKFNRKDTFCEERYEREKSILRTLSINGLCPHLHSFNDNKLELFIEYIEQKSKFSFTYFINNSNQIIKNIILFHDVNCDIYMNIINNSITLTPNLFVEKQEKLPQKINSIKEKLNISSIEDTGSQINHILSLMDTELILIRKGLLHTDLHPGNILFRESGDVCFIDFGRARVGEISYDLALFIFKTTSLRFYNRTLIDTINYMKLIVKIYSELAKIDFNLLIKNVWLFFMFVLADECDIFFQLDRLKLKRKETFISMIRENIKSIGIIAKNQYDYNKIKE